MMDQPRFSELPVQKLSEDAILPTRAHPEDAGLDLYALEDVILPPGEGRMAKTGVAIALPVGFVALIADRSSLAKKGIKTAGGVIDAGYRGEIMVVLWNLSKQEIKLSRQERIAQLLTLPIATPAVQLSSNLEATARGAGGFGSSGK